MPIGNKEASPNVSRFEDGSVKDFEHLGAVLSGRIFLHDPDNGRFERHLVEHVVALFSGHSDGCFKAELVQFGIAQPSGGNGSADLNDLFVHLSHSSKDGDGHLRQKVEVLCGFEPRQFYFRPVLIEHGSSLRVLVHTILFCLANATLELSLCLSYSVSYCGIV